nr:MAG TPA: hypothetical protein [Caudoviricetes sp.]
MTCGLLRTKTIIFSPKTTTFLAFGRFPYSMMV